jgi:hypothetical protein
MSSNVHSHLLAISASGSPENESHPSSRILFTIWTSVTKLSIDVGATCGTYVASATRGAGTSTWGIIFITALTIWVINIESGYGTGAVTGTAIIRGGTSFRWGVAGMWEAESSKESSLFFFML